MELVRPEGRAEAVARWRVRAAEWRAAEVAEAVFGGRVVPRLTGLGGSDFQGLLELEVPFRDLAKHRRAESRFLAAAARDPLLSAVPLVVTFAPREWVRVP